MELTKPKSIFDIPKPLPTAEEVEAAKPKRRKKRSKTPKKKRPKTAKAGGVEVSQVQKGSKNQITLKQKGGLTQEITIFTGDAKNTKVGRGGRSSSNTPNWNMKPAKFKKSRGLRDDRVYLQPPKREYFGNRYKSALDKIKIDQKVKESGASKNKEIADVRDTARREREQLTQRTRALDDTVSELRREKAGIVASHNVSQRNQSRATILGGDVGELNKLIGRRGYDSIRRLVMKGEITDASTLLQLDLTGAQIDRLVGLLEGERADYPRGSKLVYLTGTGVSEEGTVLEETDKFVKMRRARDGGNVRVPKSNIQTGQRVAEARGVSADPVVRSGVAIPTGSDFGTPRPAGSSAEERPAHRRDRPDKLKAEKKQRQRRERKSFVAEAEQQQFTESSSSSDNPFQKGVLSSIPVEVAEAVEKTADARGRAKADELISQLEARTLSKARSPTPNLDALRSEPGKVAGRIAALEEVSFQTAPEKSESDISSGASGEDEGGLKLELRSSASGSPQSEVAIEAPLPREEEEELEDWEIAAQQQFTASPASPPIPRVKPKSLSVEELQRQVDKIGEGAPSIYNVSELGSMIDLVSDKNPSKAFLQSSFRTFKERPRIGPIQTEEDKAIQRGRQLAPLFAPQKSFRDLTPRQLAAEQRRREREESQERVSAVLRKSGKVSSRTNQFLERERTGGARAPSPEPEPERRRVTPIKGEQAVEYTQSDIDAHEDLPSGSSDDEAIVLDKRPGRERKGEDGKIYYPGSYGLTYTQIKRQINSVFEDEPRKQRMITAVLEKAKREQRPFQSSNPELLESLGLGDSTSYSPAQRGDDDL